MLTSLFEDRSEGMQILDARWRYLDSSCLGWELCNAEHWPPGMDFATPFVNKYHRRGRVVQALLRVLFCFAAFLTTAGIGRWPPSHSFVGISGAEKCWKNKYCKSGIGDCGLHGICHVTFCNFAIARHFGLAEPVWWPWLPRRSVVVPWIDPVILQRVASGKQLLVGLGHFQALNYHVLLWAATLCHGKWEGWRSGNGKYVSETWWYQGLWVWINLGVNAGL